MNNFDYEIRGYCVEWWIGEKKYKQDDFHTEESAAEFAMKMSKKSDSVTLIQEKYAIDWRK